MAAIQRNWKKYMPVILLVLIQCTFFKNNVEDYQEVIDKAYELSVGDYIVNFYRGTLPYTMLGKDIPFNIPGIWSFYFIYFFAVNCKIISRMFQKSEYQSVIRYRTRSCWFHHQSGKLGLEVTRYLSITYLTFFLYGLFTGASMTGVNRELQMEFNGLDLTEFCNYELIILTVVMPWIVMIALSYFQYIISIKTNTIVGMLASIVILVSSVFHMNSLLIGNYLMVRRYEKLLPGGVNVITGILVCIVSVIVSFLLGEKAIEKKDLF